MSRFLVLALLLALSPSAQAADDYLSGDELEALIVGKTIRGEVYYENGETAYYGEYNGPEGEVLSYTFLEGDALSEFLYAESLGRWKIVGDKYCYRWRGRPDEVQCNVVARQGYLYVGYELLDQARGLAKDNLRLFFTIEAVEDGDRTGDLQALYSSFGESL